MKGGLLPLHFALLLCQERHLAIQEALLVLDLAARGLKISSLLAEILLECRLGGVGFLPGLEFQLLEANLDLALGVFHDLPGALCGLGLLPADEAAVEEVFGAGQQAEGGDENGEDQVHGSPSMTPREPSVRVPGRRRRRSVRGSGEQRKTPAWPWGAGYLNLASQQGDPALTSGFPAQGKLTMSRPGSPFK